MNNNINKLINILNTAVVQAKVYHFNLTLAGAHMHVGTFYDDLGELFDDLVEEYIGLNRVENPEYTLSFDPIQLLTLKQPDDTDEIKFYFYNVSVAIQKIKDSLGLELKTLNNTIDDILSRINKFLYQISLI